MTALAGGSRDSLAFPCTPLLSLRGTSANLGAGGRSRTSLEGFYHPLYIRRGGGNNSACFSRFSGFWLLAVLYGLSTAHPGL